MIHKVLQDPLGSITGPKKIDQDLIAINVAMTNRVRYRVAIQLKMTKMSFAGEIHLSFVWYDCQLKTIIIWYYLNGIFIILEAYIQFKWFILHISKFQFYFSPGQLLEQHIYVWLWEENHIFIFSCARLRPNKKVTVNKPLCPSTPVPCPVFFVGNGK